MIGLTVAALWKIFQKMGHEGWKGIIPYYNLYILFQELYGNGWRFLLMAIPIYNIYVYIKLFVDLAHAFHKSTGFGVGAAFFPEIYLCILAFGSSSFGDGRSEIHHEDVISSGKATDKDIPDGHTAGPARPVPPKTSNQVHCPSCGKICPSVSRFCDRCGVSLTDAPKLISTFKVGGEAASYAAKMREGESSGGNTLPSGFSRPNDSDL